MNINIKESQFSIQGQIYDVWENYCAKILESGDLSTFKKHPHIEYMTEHNNLERYAPEWLQQINDKIQKLDIDKNIVLTALRKNEKYGGSTKSITIEDFKVHANSIKYANIALELIIDWNKKELNNVNLIEIGGGYGGFSLILNEILKGLNRDIISEYILIDLKNVINLQQKYLELNNVKCNFRFINGEDVQKLKLNDRYYLFSSYSLSEIPKEVRHFYYEKLFNNVDNGLLYWNTEHIDLLGYKLDIKNEKPSTGFYNKIVYFNKQ